MSTKTISRHGAVSSEIFLVSVYCVLVYEDVIFPAFSYFMFFADDSMQILHDKCLDLGK